MTKVELIIDNNIYTLQNKVNDFIKEKFDVFVTTAMCQGADGVMEYLATVCYKE